MLDAFAALHKSGVKLAATRWGATANSNSSLPRFVGT